MRWVLNLNPVPLISGNAPQLRSLLDYLIQNALEALPKGQGTITFTTQVEPRNWVILEIRDTGCGMSSEVLNARPNRSSPRSRVGAGRV